MKITTPLSKLEEVDALIKSGANEFYCGLTLDDWRRKYQLYNTNDRSNQNSNFSDLNTLRQAIDICKTYDIPVFLTLNSIYYTDKQIPDLIHHIEKSIKIGINGFIVTDLGVLSLLNNMNTGIRLHVSTINAVLNSQACLFYKEYNVKRIVLERQITIDEVKNIRKKISGIELELFVFNIKCLNMEGLCNFQHNLSMFKHSIFSKITKHIPKYSNKLNLLKNMPNCMINFLKNRVSGEVPAFMSGYNVELVESDPNFNETARKNIDERINGMFKNKIAHSDCGICGLYDFNKMGIEAIKIAGRRFPLSRKLRDLEIVNKAKEIVMSSEQRGKAINQLRELFHQYENIKKCNLSNCFFPMGVN